MNYKKQALYNTVGNLVYMAALWLISVLIVHITGFEDAGVFSIAMSVGNVFFFIAVYGMRSFQGSDSLYQYSPGEYCTVRWITTGTAALCLTGYLLFAGYSFYISAAVIAYTLYKFAESASDVFFGELQRVGHLEICGISMSVKGVLSIAVFSAVLFVTKNLPAALLAMVLLAVAILIVYDIKGYRKYCPEKLTAKKEKVLSLLREGFPMLLTTVFPIVVTAVPRLAIEAYLGTEVLGIYSSISTPTVLITTLVPNILAPFMTLFGHLYHEGNLKKLYRMLWVSLIATAALGAVACALAYFLGDFVMGLVFGKEIVPHLGIFIPLILATTVYAFSMAANSVLISIRRPAFLTAFSAAALVLSLIAAYPLVERFGQMGAVWAYGLPFAAQFLLQLVFLTVALLFPRKKQTK
ncbi:MAG: oligosaccharide flippase family protein [Clostridia bacterium]|nr:oligosaccharide flippase family protein [Clostridia bacterium]